MAAVDFLRVVDGPSRGAQCDLRGRIVIGRSEVALRIDDPAVSRTHAVVDANDPAMVTVADAGSSRGTTLDGRRVTDPVPLPPGGRLAVGRSHVLRLRAVRFPTIDGAEVEAVGPDQSTLRASLQGVVRIGRDPASELFLDHPSVSRAHCIIRDSPDGPVIQDSGSRVGVLVNGRSLTGARTIGAEDEIEIPGSGWMLRIARHEHLAAAPRLLRFRLEGADGAAAVRISARPLSTVGDVARALADTAGWPHSDEVTIYRESDGLVLRSGDRWSDVQFAPGDLVAVADVPVGPVADLAGGSAATVVRPGQRVVADPVPVVIDAPRAPETASLRGRGVMWQLAGGLAGIVGGLVIALALQNWLFAIVGLVAGLGAAASGVLGDRSRRVHRVSDFRSRVAALEDQAQRTVASQERDLRLRSPAPPARLPALRAASGVWSRGPADPDALRVRLGAGERAARLRVAVPAGDVDAEFQGDLDAVGRVRTLKDVPILGPRGGSLGLVGPARIVDSAARSLVLDAAFHHAPSVLAIHLVARSDEWDGIVWLPHLTKGDGVRIHRGPRAGIDTSRAVAADLRDGALCVVVGAAATLADSDLLSDASSALLVVVTADAPARLPRTVTRWIEYESSSARAIGDFEDGPLEKFTPDAVGPAEAEEEALAGAQLSDPHVDASASPPSSSLLELNGVVRGGTVDIADSWRAASGRGLTAIIGADGSNSPVQIDLTIDGPHAVIAGTTGSGKSELLAALLGSLVARHSPEDLALFLIDFKGGATFRRFAATPHVVGLVTDLEQDGGLTERAFASLEIELARRKRVLAAARASDLDAYRAAGTGPGIPRLLVVIDEFALLVQSNPEVRSRLDAVAAQGRSLGVHLVLATQSPGGVLSPAIRANTNLWISLRVVSDAESREVLGSLDAARLPANEPGRGYIRRGAETRAASFQTARVTVARDPADERRVAIARLWGPEVTGEVSATRSSAASASQRQDLDLLLDAVEYQFRRGGHQAPDALWVDPLPEIVHASELDDARPGDFPVRIGLADLVARQRTETHSFDLAVTGILVTGAPRTGRSTTLLQVATDLAAAHAPARLHIYGIHAGGPLSRLQGLTHVAGIVQVDDLERVARVLDMVSELIAQRRSRQSDAGEARVLLLVDDYPSVREVMESRLPARALDQLLAIIIGGRPVGVHVALATSQPGDIRIAATAGLGHRVMLAAVDRADYQAIDVRPPAGAPVASIPGRAILAGNVDLQVALPAMDRVREIDAAWPHEGAPRPVVSLPTSVRVEDLGSSEDEAGDVIGLGARELAPVSVSAKAGAHLVVLGESGSGRSSALLTIGRAHLARVGSRLVIFAPRGGPLESLRFEPGVALFASDPDSAAAVIDVVSQPSGSTLLLIDDADRWPAMHGDSLERVLRRAPELALRAAIAARSGDWVRSFESWVRYIGSLKSGLLLTRAPEVASAFDVRLEPVVAPPAPGRGFLVERGHALFLQVADPSPRPGSSPDYVGDLT